MLNVIGGAGTPAADLGHLLVGQDPASVKPQIDLPRQCVGGIAVRCPLLVDSAPTGQLDADRGPRAVRTQLQQPFQVLSQDAHRCLGGVYFVGLADSCTGLPGRRFDLAYVDVLSGQGSRQRRPLEEVPSTATRTLPMVLRPIHAIARFMPAAVTGKVPQIARIGVLVVMGTD